MANVTVTIAPDGTPTPSSIQVDPGDTVGFHADGVDVVLCVLPKTVFGSMSFIIPEDTTLNLLVQNFASSGPFEYITLVGDLEAECEGRGDEDGEGGGNVGGGPD